jgi:hypothetical protein
MIDLLVKDLKEGLPSAVVIGESMRHSVGHLLPRVMGALGAVGPEPIRRRADLLEWAGSEIRFQACTSQKRLAIGRKAGEYWDHFAVGED